MIAEKFVDKFSAKTEEIVKQSRMSRQIGDAAGRMQAILNVITSSVLLDNLWYREIT